MDEQERAVKDGIYRDVQAALENVRQAEARIELTHMPTVFGFESGLLESAEALLIYCEAYFAPEPARI